jgi:4-amino-4-deoxy-L-arabinose transferase-like glycosyltransferase
MIKQVKPSSAEGAQRISAIQPPEPLKSAWVVYISLVLLALAVRWWAVDVPINLDEFKWLHRGLGFWANLLRGNLGGTYFQHHPGVPTMWVNGAGMMGLCLLRDRLPTYLELGTTTMLGCVETLLNHPFMPLEAYVICRLLQGVITAVCSVYLWHLARHLWGNAIALIGSVLLILEPFFLGYQRLVITDAMQSMFLAIALLTLLHYLHHRKLRQLVASGLWMGLAIATKTPTVMVLPGIAAWMVLTERGLLGFPTLGSRQRWRDGLIWSGVILTTIVVIWPALWVAPVSTLSELVRDLTQEINRGYFFFLGEITDSPGILFYPLTLLFRSSPVVIVGVAWAGMALVIPRWRQQFLHRRDIWAIALAVLSILVGLSLSSNKIDRYILPTLPLLSFLAAMGWWHCGTMLHSWHHKFFWHSSSKLLNWRNNWRTATALVGVFLQGLILIPHLPYGLTYFDPLVGGTTVAQQILMIGNGEGLDQVARWLNQTPRADQMTVASWYLPAFAPYFQGHSLDIDRRPDTDTTRQWWQQAQRVVLYINQWQRDLPSAETLAYFAQQEPLYRLNLDGVDYARVYPGAIALPSDLDAAQPLAQQVSNSPLTPVAYTLEFLTAPDMLSPTDPPMDGPSIRLTLYWQVTDALPDNTAFDLTLHNTAQSDAKPTQIWRLEENQSPRLRLLYGLLAPSDIPPETLLRDVHRFPLPTAVAAEGSLEGYALTLRWRVGDRIETVTLRPAL